MLQLCSKLVQKSPSAPYTRLPARGERCIRDSWAPFFRRVCVGKHIYRTLGRPSGIRRSAIAERLSPWGAIWAPKWPPGCPRGALWGHFWGAKIPKEHAQISKILRGALFILVEQPGSKVQKFGGKDAVARPYGFISKSGFRTHFESTRLPEGAPICSWSRNKRGVPKIALLEQKLC